MKKILILPTVLLITLMCFSQSPQFINYQAVARNNAGQALANQNIKVRLSIISGNTTLYSETRLVITNLLGLFNVQIGSGGASDVIGVFNNIAWMNNFPDMKMIKVELDINNSGLFTDMGSQTLSSVPYAFAAENARRIGKQVVSETPPAMGDILSYNGATWSPKKLIETYKIDGSTSNPSTITGNTIYKFYGPTITVTITEPKTINAVISATLGATTNSPEILFDICYENISNPVGVIPFSPNLFTNQHKFVNNQFTNLTASNTRLFSTGTYKIGFGLRNNGNTPTAALDKNGYVNGLVIIY